MTTKSDRNVVDGEATMGVAATQVVERVLASIGRLGKSVDIRFRSALDVRHAGVLLAVPALLATGLLRHARRYFSLPQGYYGLESIFLVLAFMALCRIRSMEALRYAAPGEWGKLLGLDRVPEVRTLREKVKLLSAQDIKSWGADLCKEWMQNDPESLGVFYVDGHVRVYHGSHTELPRHYIARERLCLRATTDYWVNAIGGLPFFYVNQAVDPGLLKVLEDTIVPELEQKTVLPEDPAVPRFIVIFDREGYSPAFLQRMKERRIACLTYHKFPGDDWPEDEFTSTPVHLVSGERIELSLAERKIVLGDSKIEIREIRKRSKSGHQTSILCTHPTWSKEVVASMMAGRWSQENFFRYMREHYGLDSLVDHQLTDIPDATPVVNPEYRDLDAHVRKQVGILQRKRAELGALSISGEMTELKVQRYERENAALQEEVEALQKTVEELKAQRKKKPRHIPISELPEDKRFQQLRINSKHFIDTIKMIAYRAETAAVNVLRAKIARPDDARSLARALYELDADLLPDREQQTLTVRLHGLAHHAHDAAIQHLCNESNATATIFPGTDLRLCFEFPGSPQIP